VYVKGNIFTVKPQIHMEYNKSEECDSVDDLGVNIPSYTRESYDKLVQAGKLILEAIGEDPSRNGIMCTPERFARSMLYMTKGYRENYKEVIHKAIFDEPTHEMVFVRGIDICSLCEHHIVPFMGKIHIAYMPNQRILGLSKLARISDHFSKRLQLQERLTAQIANAISDSIQALGVGVVIEATHMCMTCRGVQKPNSETLTFCMLGLFKTDASIRETFLGFLKHDSCKIRDLGVCESAYTN